MLALDGEFHPQKLIRGVEHMGALVLGQLKQVLDSYACRDLDKAHAVWQGDEEIDALCISLFRELLTYMMEDPRHITFCIHLLFMRQEHRAHGRPRDQHRRDRALHDRGTSDRRPAPEGRHHQPRRHVVAARN